MSELKQPAQKKHEVTYSLAYKRNTGNFENLTVHVGLTVEGYGNPEPTLAKARQFVEDNLGTAMEEVTAAIEGK